MIQLLGATEIAELTKLEGILVGGWRIDKERWGNRKEAVKKSNQRDMDEKNPFFGVFSSTAVGVEFLDFSQFRVLIVGFRGDTALIEMRRGRLSIKKSPWFDFFTASYRPLDETLRFRKITMKRLRNRKV